MAMAMARKTGDKTKSASTEPTMSSVRLATERLMRAASWSAAAATATPGSAAAACPSRGRSSRSLRGILEELRQGVEHRRRPQGLVIGQPVIVGDVPVGPEPARLVGERPGDDAAHRRPVERDRDYLAHLLGGTPEPLIERRGIVDAFGDVELGDGDLEPGSGDLVEEIAENLGVK